MEAGADDVVPGPADDESGPSTSYKVRPKAEYLQYSGDQ
jgi:hypothetical protein